jgi:hypothetical protein
MAMVARLIAQFTQVDLQCLWRSSTAEWRKPVMPEDSIELEATVRRWITLSKHAVHYLGRER